MATRVQGRGDSVGRLSWVRFEGQLHEIAHRKAGLADSLDTPKLTAEVKEGMNEFCQRNRKKERVTEREREQQHTYSHAPRTYLEQEAGDPHSTHSY